MFEIEFKGLYKNYKWNMEENKTEKNMMLIGVMEYVEYNQNFECKRVSLIIGLVINVQRGIEKLN